MKAVVYNRYGSPDVLQITELAKPIPGDKDILIRVIATSVTKFDCWMRSCTSPPGFGLIMRLASGLKPKQPILGTEISGIVEAVGKNTRLYKIGDEVYGTLGIKMGAYVEYKCLPEDSVLVRKPANITHEEAAAAQQGAMTALYFLRKADIRRGHKVLVYGASGGVGSAAVQIAKYLGAEVTGVCSPSKAEFVRGLGADVILNYEAEYLAEDGLPYDIIFDTVGLSPFSRCRKALDKDGYYLSATLGLPRMIQLIWMTMTSHQKAFFGELKETEEDLLLLQKLYASGAIRPVFERSFSMKDIAAAHRYIESGAKKGNIAMVVSNDSGTQ